MIEGNSVHPFLPARVYNQIIRAEMAHQPYAGISHSSLCPEMAETLEATDAQDQMRQMEGMKHFFYHSRQAMIPLPVHQGPSHSLSKNDGGYAYAFALPLP